MKLIDLKENNCRWPIGDPKDKDFHFCGRRTGDGKTYCQNHHKQAYTATPRKETLDVDAA